MNKELAAAMVPMIEIRRLEVIPIRVRLTFQRKLSKGQVSLGGADPRVGAPVLIRVESAAGVVGVGQVRPPTPWLGESTDSIVSAVRDYYGPSILRTDAAETELLGRRLDAVLPGNTVARAGLEMAVLDLVGKTLGLPVYSLLGGARREIPLDWSISLNASEVMVAEAMKGVNQHGVGIICLKAGPSRRWREDVEVFRAVRAAVGQEVEIGIDPNEGYDLPTAIRVLRELEPERVAYVEQPLPRSDLDGFRILRGQAGVPILLDESAITLLDAFRAVQSGAGDALVLKIWKSGGILGARKMAALADAAGVGVTVGGVAHGSLLEAAACAHLYSSLEAPGFAAEFALGLNVVDNDPIAKQPDGFVLANGTTTAPAGPGLGIEVDPAAVEEVALARHTVE
jgi:L-alanine-DL-glutamate epimerase-like enolase superfamily enzyme